MSSRARWLIYLVVAFVVVCGVFWLMFGNRVKALYVGQKTRMKLESLLNPADETIPSGRGAFVLDIKSGEDAFHVEVGFAFRKPDCYRMDIMGDLGDYVIVAGPKKMWAYVKKRNFVFVGDPSLPMWRMEIPPIKKTRTVEKAEASSSPPVVLAGVAFGEASEKPPQDLLDLLNQAGLANAINAEFKETKKGPNGEAKLFVFTARKNAPKELQGAKANVWIQDYLPTLVEISVPDQDLTIKASLKDLDLGKNIDESSFAFTPPKGAKTKVVPRKQMEMILKTLPSILWDISQ